MNPGLRYTDGRGAGRSNRFVAACAVPPLRVQSPRPDAAVDRSLRTWAFAAAAAASRLTRARSAASICRHT
jgi:hypothetical protein